MGAQQYFAAGRLSRTGTVQRLITSYGVSRLGLVPFPHGEPSTDVPRPPEKARRRTFRLPQVIVHRLKAYATITKQFQYVVVAHAIRWYLDRAVQTLGLEQRSDMQKLIRRYQDGQPSPGAQQSLEQAFRRPSTGDMHPRKREGQNVWDNVCSPFRGLWNRRN